MIKEKKQTNKNVFVVVVVTLSQKKFWNIKKTYIYL